MLLVHLHLPEDTRCGEYDKESLARIPTHELNCRRDQVSFLDVAGKVNSPQSSKTLQPYAPERSG